MKLSYQERAAIQKAAHLIRNERGQYVREDEVKVLMGLDAKAKWPDHGVNPARVQGVTVWVLSKDQAKGLGVFQRARCKCPVCDKDVPVGRLAQHALAHA